jgi:hypothetical protein
MMSKVKFLEIQSSPRLRKTEAGINGAIAAAGLIKASVRLFETADGEIGYSVQLVPTAGGKQALERVHRIVCDKLGYRRGRPPGRRTHQVKCRVSETAYERLKQEARRRRTTPSGVLADLVERHARAAGA